MIILYKGDKKMDISLAIGQKIRQRRVFGFNLDQTGLGSMAGLSKLAISKIERGKQPLKHANIIALAKALKVPIEWFFDVQSPWNIPPVNSPLPAHAEADRQARFTKELNEFLEEIDDEGFEEERLDGMSKETAKGILRKAITLCERKTSKKLNQPRHLEHE